MQHKLPSFKLHFAVNYRKRNGGSAFYVQHWHLMSHVDEGTVQVLHVLREGVYPALITEVE